MAARILLLPLLLLLFLLLLGSPHCSSAASASASRRLLQTRRSGDPNSQVKFDFSPFLIEYKSGRVKRLMGTEVVAASSDPLTGVTSRDAPIAGGVSARLYLPSLRATARAPVLVYFHGGAFVVESAFEPIYHAYLNALASRAGALAVSVNYRLAPEHPLPAAYDDSWAALRWVLSGADPWLAQYGDLSRLFLAGDSAGGNIAHNLALRVGEEGLGPDGGAGARIRGVALLDPYFQGRGSPVGADAVDPAYLQSAARTWSFICAGRYPLDHPYADPLVLPADSWRRLSAERVLVTVSGQDRLSPWQRAYYAALRDSGWPGEAELYETPGEGHVYFLTKLGSPQALAEMAKLVAFINRD